MPETQTPTNIANTPNSSNPTSPEAATTPANTPESTIDFSQFSLGTEPEKKEEKKAPAANPFAAQPQETAKPTQEETKSVIAQFNEMKEEKKEDVQIQNIQITETEQHQEEKIQLGTSGVTEQHQGKEINDMQAMMICYIVIAIAGIGTFLCNMYQKYITIASTTAPTEYSQELQTYQTIKKTISPYVGSSEYNSLSNTNTLFTAGNSTGNMISVIQNSALNYLQKKEIIGNNLQALSQEIVNNARSNDDLKKETSKYGFIPKELYETIEQERGITNIRKTMLLMENIKFLISFKAFSYMDSFVQSFANSIGKDTKETREKIQEISTNGEERIITYTNTCYFNPYEISYDCNSNHDFDNYYTLIDKDTSIDNSFFKKLVAYVDMKLQQEDVPLLSIKFPTFDPGKPDISFNLDLNTTPDDEIILNTQQDTSNPHLFIVTNIINLLKQSLLVIGEGIKSDQIKTRPKTIRIGSTTFTFNNSNINFKLPIQTPSQREISDFFTTTK